MVPRRHAFVTLLALCCACAVEDSGEGPDNTSDAGGGLNGVPVEGYPSYQERLMLVAINRARADPNNVEAGTADACSEEREPQPPVLYHPDIAQAARFHCLHLGLNDGGLSHDSYCELREDLESSGCDGSAECSCVPGTECWSCDTLGGCGTQYTGRLRRFGFDGSAAGEVGAAGTGDGWSAVGLWITENPCSSDTLGHRNIVTSPSAHLVGTGVYSGPGCWGSYAFADFGREDNVSVPVLVSGVHRPELGGAETAYTYYANYFSEGGAPRLVAVVVDGACHELTLELGSDENATYLGTASVAEPGCAEYYFLARDGAGRRAAYPQRGAFLIEAGGDCQGESYRDSRMPDDCP